MMHQKSASLRINNMDRLDSKINLAEYLAVASMTRTPEGLLDRIVLKIERRRFLLASLKLLSSFAGLAGLSVFIVFNWSGLVSEILAMPLLQVGKIIVTDFAIIKDNWQDFAWFILETTPAYSLLLFSVAAWLSMRLLYSIFFFLQIKEFKNNFKIKSIL